MKIQVTAIEVVGDQTWRAQGMRATVNVRVDSTFTINQCALFEREDGTMAVYPPKGRKKGQPPVSWQRQGEFAKDMLDAVLDAYGALTDDD